MKAGVGRLVSAPSTTKLAFCPLMNVQYVVYFSVNGLYFVAK